MRIRLVVATVVGIIVATVATADDSGRQYFAPPAGAGASLPFSEAVMVGDTLYVAGHIGLDPKTQKAAADIDVEAHAVMDAVKHTVESTGLKMDDLVSVTVYCTDLGLYDAFNAVYRTYFQGHYPTRAFIGVSSLVRGAHFEVAGIAARPAQRK
ncbi:MAG: RidA family protein [Steroidobacteraceae bacterium]|jgi:2-iminobutanoate/2-iminopropanoate deaminase